MVRNNTENKNINLQKLLERQKKLNQKIKLEKQKAKEKEKEKVTQKCMLTGAIILDYIENKGEFSEQILNILSSSIESESEKELLGIKAQPETGDASTIESKKI